MYAIVKGIFQRSQYNCVTHVSHEMPFDNFIKKYKFHYKWLCIKLLEFFIYRGKDTLYGFVLSYMFKAVREPK